LFITYRSFIESALLALSLSADIFVAFAAYGGTGMRVPRRTALSSALICSGIFIAFGLIGTLVCPAVPAGVSKAIGFFTLFVIGLMRIFDSSVKAFIRKLKRRPGKIIEVYADPQKADLDLGGELSPREGALLAAAMSLDGAAAGFGTGAAACKSAAVAGAPALCGGVMLTAVLSFFFCITAIALGFLLGQKLKGTRAGAVIDMSAAAGLTLLALAFWRLA
jgi:putative Mn2+ efflux pump MntP